MIQTRLTSKIFVAATILVSVFTLFFGIYEYRREHAFRVDILHSQLQLNNYHFLEQRGDREIRVTVTDTLGNVLSDTEKKDVSRMGNHQKREEIKEALHCGSGYAIKRASETNGEKYFYSATRFGDRIVRSSVPYSAELTSSLERDYTFFYYTAGILALLAVVMYFRHRYEYSEREKLRIKRQLTENAAHELKTPAATIEGYLETLVGNPHMAEDKRKTFLEKCHAQSRRMSSLLADMSTLTRLDEARIVRPATVIDAAAILRQVREETAEQFREQGMELLWHVPETLPMSGDASLIDSLFRNVFSNVLSHAMGATCFKVEARVTGERYTFIFADNGPGVPAAHLPHLFERFYRIDKGRSRRLGGTGLGLAIVKNIALQYGGSAAAAPTPGGGLTLEVELAAGV
ncbi:MAG: HAMP domain-containing histidine kinase [Bacteroidaceae bacterium]|nr:HAMP domain-containing histidine kinase [Bacteroidaceae bacterium]